MTTGLTGEMKSRIAQLSKNKTRTPVEIFDAQPYVHFQRQLYFAKVNNEFCQSVLYGAI